MSKVNDMPLNKHIKINLILFISIEIFILINCEKCERKSLVSFPYRTQFICTDVINSFHELLNKSYAVTCVNCNIPIFISETAKHFNGDNFNVSNSHVRSIDRTAFDTFWPKMSRFYFNNNEIKYVETGIFNRFTELLLINLSKNNISELTSKEFDNVNTRILDLSYNKLTQIYSDTFGSLTIETFNLSFNQITDIQIGAFDDVTFVKGKFSFMTSPTIELQSNSINKIERGTFKSKGQLKVIRLDFNKIRRIPNNTFENLNLEQINLSHNEIEVLDNCAFCGAPSLNILILNDNNIGYILNGVLSLPNLITLQLAYNKIELFEVITFSGTPKLRNLNVSHNELVNFKDSTLFPIGNLEVLDISYNRINQLNTKIFLQHHARISKLHIKHNFWQCKDLITMYKLLQNRKVSLELNGNDFDVHNLHGIPCSKMIMTVTSDLTFDKYMEILRDEVNAQEDLFNIKLDEDTNLNDDMVASYVGGIHAMLVFITISFTLLFIYYVINYLFGILERNNILPKSFSTFYNINNEV